MSEWVIFWRWGIMNTIFIGTSHFAVASLEVLIASHHNLLAVVTQPDKPRGRGREMQISPVKEVALAHGVPILQPEKIGERRIYRRDQSFWRLPA